MLGAAALASDDVVLFTIVDLIGVGRLELTLALKVDFDTRKKYVVYDPLKGLLNLVIGFVQFAVHWPGAAQN
tara:strand:+ start:369 stop:584 length:216 start_codon:yes stop_codon:yes gene_type:complete